MVERRHRLVVDGAVHDVVAAPAATLLDVLRGPVGNTSPKLACERGECGTCTVLVGDRPVVACVTLVALVDAPVTTAQGLGDAALDLREALADTGGFQCGYCTAGQVVLGHWVADNVGSDGAGPPDDRAVDEQAIRHLMSGVLCRCTGGGPIADAVVDVAGRRR